MEFGGGEEERATTLSVEASGQRIGAVHLAEKLCFFYLPNPYYYKASARAKGTAEGWRVGARYVVRGHNKTVLNEEP